MHLDFWDYLTFASLAKKRRRGLALLGENSSAEASWTEEI
jgi:hypothetical protein